MCFTRQRYQVSVYKTIGPLVVHGTKCRTRKIIYPPLLLKLAMVALSKIKYMYIFVSERKEHLRSSKFRIS